METGELKKDALDTLSQIRSLIIEVFATHPFDDFGDFLNNIQTPLMVRSTGIEDTVDVANPGGNESLSAVKPNPLDVSHAIGVVVASYFSEKSLKQRLLSQASNITAEPFIPVLLQHMIFEAMNAHEHDVVRSGVMYTHDFETRIQMAPGHGELIVNSKGPFDTFIVSEQNIIYSEIQQKPIRLVPQEVTDEGRVVRELVIKENTPSLKKDACIAPGVAIRIAQIGRAIHDHYGMPMDVEFVYNPKDDEIALVQARPIPKGDLAYIKPSSIPPSTMLELKKQNILPIECTVITAAGYEAKIIRDKREIIICDTLEQALTQYLQEKNSALRAVLVKELAPTTSHEAAQFSSKAIPVLQVHDKAQHERMKAFKGVLIIDPQRNQVIDWVGDRPPESIIEAGLFSLPIAPITPTLLNYLPEERHLSLFGFLSQKKDPKASRQKVSSLLLGALEQLEAAQPGQFNQESRQALNAIAALFIKIATSTNSKKPGAPHKTLGVYAITLCWEIEPILTRYEQTHEPSKQAFLREVLLMRIAKLKSLVRYPGHAQVLSHSLMQIAEENKAQDECFHLVPSAKDLAPQALDYLMSFIALAKIALNEKTQRAWAQFAYYCCQNKKHQQPLAHLIKFSVHHGMESDLLHRCFMGALHEHQDDLSAVLEKMVLDYARIAKELEALNLDGMKRVIQSLRQRINEWSRPDLFERLWRGYEADIKLLSSTLNIDKKMSLATKKAVLHALGELVEVMDLTIKSLKGSSEYKSSEAQVKRFVCLLEPYHALMHQWMLKIPERQYSEWAKGIRQASEFNAQGKMLRAIADKFQSKKSLKTHLERELLPSGRFSVASAQVGTTASFGRQFVDIPEITLEDLFSLMHQNLLFVIAYFAENQEYLYYLPKEFQGMTF